MAGRGCKRRQHAGTVAAQPRSGELSRPPAARVDAQQIFAGRHEDEHRIDRRLQRAQGSIHLREHRIAALARCRRQQARRMQQGRFARLLPL